MDSATSMYLAVFGMVSGFALMNIGTDEAGAQTVWNSTIAKRLFPPNYQDAAGCVDVQSALRFGPARM